MKQRRFNENRGITNDYLRNFLKRRRESWVDGKNGFKKNIENEDPIE